MATLVNKLEAIKIEFCKEVDQLLSEPRLRDLPEDGSIFQQFMQRALIQDYLTVCLHQVISEIENQKPGVLKSYKLKNQSWENSLDLEDYLKENFMEGIDYRKVVVEKLIVQIDILLPCLLEDKPLMVLIGEGL